MKVLYLVHELPGLAQRSSSAVFAQKLIKDAVKIGHNVRVIMPKFASINTRKNRIYEVQRLCGININVGKERISLLGLVGSIPNVKAQAYFIDNEVIFQNKTFFHDADGTFYPDNALRTAFICKSVVAILKNLKWAPDIVHCIGLLPWLLVPLYGKHASKSSFVFKNTKYIYTYDSLFFKESLGEKLWKNSIMYNLQKESLAPLGPNADFTGCLALSKAYADATTYSFDETQSPALEFLKNAGIPHIPNDDSLLESYRKIYADLAPSSNPSSDT